MYIGPPFFLGLGSVNNSEGPFYETLLANFLPATPFAITAPISIPFPRPVLSEYEYEYQYEYQYE